MTHRKMIPGILAIHYAPDFGGSAGGAGAGSAGQGGGQGNDSGQQQNNQQGNTGQQNNSGQQQPARSFWADPEQDNSGSTSGPVTEGQNQSGNGQQGQQQNQNGFSQRFSAGLQQYNTPQITTEVIEQMASGNLDGFNTVMRDSHRQTVQHTMKEVGNFLSELVPAIQKQLRDEFSGIVDTRFGQKDNNDALSQAFPGLASDKEVRPMLEQVFKQALRLNPGNREAAIAKTREMMAMMGTSTARELNLNVAPRDTEMEFIQQSSKDVVQDMLGLQKGQGR